MIAVLSTVYIIIIIILLLLSMGRSAYLHIQS